MPHNWIPGLRQADCIGVELRSKNAYSEKYAAIMADGSEYWLDRVTSVIKEGIRVGDGLLWWRGDQTLIGAYEHLLRHVTSIQQCQPGGLESKILEWANEQLNPESDSLDERIRGLQNAKLTIEISHHDLIEGLHRSRMRHKKESDRACQLGTRAHYLVELWIKNNGDLSYHHPETGEVLEYDLSREEPEVQNALAAFKKFWDANRMTHIGSELLVYDLDIGVAGRLDHVQQNEHGQKIIWDLKTSKDFYEDMLLQVAGYAGMAQKCGHGMAKAAYIVRVDKQTAQVSVMPVYETFEQFRDLYQQFRAVVRQARFFKWADAYMKPYRKPPKSKAKRAEQKEVPL